MNSRDYLIQQLKDARFATEYFVQAANSGDQTTLQRAVNDIMDTECYRFVELTKLRAIPHATSQPGNWDEYRPGDSSNTTSPPVDYQLIGILLGPPRVGDQVRLLRTSRNGVAVPGVFVSTTVAAIDNDKFVTANSVYRMCSRPIGESSL
jgi:hypothetical protein